MLEQTELEQDISQLCKKMFLAQSQIQYLA